MLPRKIFVNTFCTHCMATVMYSLVCVKLNAIFFFTFNELLPYIFVSLIVSFSVDKN